METITIPSPTAFLRSPILQPTVPRPTPKNAARRQSTATKTRQPSITAADAATKPKQSKSRNGCVTCKAKRLKCDEIKPSCQQCHKRNVTCGGYKKDFKWRPFEESTFVSKPPSPARARKGTIAIYFAMAMTDRHSVDDLQGCSSSSSKPCDI
ncbi:MAG: C6 finger domain-containing [Lasallia pustulata]|uniref:C6 finger domain-containing n=1 Tax=Lasallia pustulata TaxID=136370 RepID=A0A5M8PXK5_9LECA|nr:MAG: C6 finger domain-containing [Lasallia pustulata]